MFHSVLDWLTILSAIIILIMGFRMLWEDQKNQAYRAFFIATLLLFIQNLFFFEMTYAETLEAVRGLRRFQESIWNVASIAFLFAMRYYARQYIRRPEYKWEQNLLWSLVLVSPFFIGLELFTSHGHGEIIRVDDSWMVMVAPFDWIDYLRGAWACGLYLLGIYFAYLPFRNAKDRISKWLRFILVFVFATILFGSFIQNYILPYLYGMPSYYNESISIGVAVLFCGLMVSNFRLLEIKSEYAMPNMLKTMTNWFVLTDTNFHIREVNKVVSNTFSKPAAKFSEMAIMDIIPEKQWSKIKKEIKELKEGQSTIFEVQFDFIKTQRNIILFTISPVFNKHEYKRGYVFLGTDLTDFFQTRNQIKQYTQELESSNQALERFAHIASHDLKEPIRNIGNFAGLLKRRLSGKVAEESEAFLQYIINNVKGMNRLIDSIMAMSLIGQNGMQPNTVDMRKMLKEVQKNLKIKIENSNAEIIIDKKMPAVYGDQQLIKQLLQNLIENSIKYNESEPPKVRVSFLPSSNLHYWTFTIQDNGIGIKEEFFDQIFDMFKRLHSRDHYEGTGVGLAICRRIVALHNGEIWVKNNETDTGTTFSFTLPQAPVQA